MSFGLIIFLATVSTGCSLDDFEPPPPPPKPVSNWTVDEARQFDDFPLYWLGETYQGLPLTAMRLESPAYKHRHAHVTFSYGQFSLSGDPYSPSWLVPLEVSIFHRCDNPPEEVVPRLDSEYLDEEEITHVQMRGVDVYLVRYPSDFDYFHIWSSSAAIFIDSWDTDFDIAEAARDLIPVTEDVRVNVEPFPPPVDVQCLGA